MNPILFKTIKRKCIKAEKHLFIFLSEVPELLYRNLRRCFSKWKLENRLCLLEAPEGRCWDEVRRALLGVALLQEKGMEAGLCRLSLRPQFRSDSSSCPTNQPCTEQMGQALAPTPLSTTARAFCGGGPGQTRKS